MIARYRWVWAILIVGTLVASLPFGAWAADFQIPNISIGIGGASSPAQTNSTIQLLVILTILSLAPSILVMVTSFTRIIIVLGFVRSAIGARQAPPNQVLVGLALFLTWFVMAPVFAKINETALQPYMAGQVSQAIAVDRGVVPLREFMFRQTRKKDIALFIKLAKLPPPRYQADVPTNVLIPAFIISELRVSFQMGFALFIPFLVIDLVISSLLMSMGMMMLPPAMISTPFKILLFIMADGWNLVVRSLVMSFH